MTLARSSKPDRIPLYTIPVPAQRVSLATALTRFHRFHHLPLAVTPPNLNNAARQSASLAIMPPKRRSSGPVLKPNKSSQQPQLLFKNGQNRVTKPSSASTASKKSPKKVKTRPSAIGDDDSLATAVETQEVELEGQGGLTTAEIAIEDQATAQHSQIESQSLTKEEEEAQRIARETDQKRLKQYWQRKEAERLAPRVHQEGLTLNEKIMREFDMSGHFGVSGHEQAAECCRASRTEDAES